VLALYGLSLGLSAGLVAVFIQQVLAHAGLVPGLWMGLFVACAAAAAYAGIQFFYVAAVRFLKPTKAPGFYFAEVLSHLCAVLLVPYPMRLRIPWPLPILSEIEPLVYAAAFGGAHGFFKLVSFYAALRGKPAGRTGSLGWLAACGLSAMTVLWAWQGWVAGLEQARPPAPETQSPYRIGGEHALARLLPEGAILRDKAAAYPGRCLTLRFANPPEGFDDASPLDRIHVAVTLEGKDSNRFTRSVRLGMAGWAEMRVPEHRFPEGLYAYSISWSIREEPKWSALTGFRPLAVSARRVLVSGPYHHETRNDQSDPNVILIAVEGLGARHLSCLGYREIRTPGLDRVAATALTFPNAYTPAPEVGAACMTLLTGVNPLRHGYLGRHHGPLPSEIKTLAELLQQKHYVTAAFIESDGQETSDLAFGTGFERGFELFDTFGSPASLITQSPETREAGAGTLDKVRAWVEAHRDVKFLIFVRLRALRDVLTSDHSSKPRSEAPFHQALSAEDRSLGAFIGALRDHGYLKNTCVVLTSPYGCDASQPASDAGGEALSEGVLRVPLLLCLPGFPSQIQPDLIELQDVVPTLLRRIGIQVLNYHLDGKDLLSGTAGKAPVSMSGDPLTLSMRAKDWRAVWRTDWSPFSGLPRIRPGTVELYNTSQTKKAAPPRDVAGQHPAEVSRLRARLEAYLRTHSHAWTKPNRGG
jgi:arylsulfatase A-like enzyme